MSRAVLCREAAAVHRGVRVLRERLERRLVAALLEDPGLVVRERVA